MFAPKYKSVLQERRMFAILVTVELMAAFILFHPLQILAQTPRPLNLPICLSAHLNSLQPTNPVDMTTVIWRTIVKTMHVEKEVFACTKPPGIFDQDIYINKTEDLSRFPPTPSTTFEVVTCAKNNTGDVLGCVQKIPHQYTPIERTCQQSFVGSPMLNTVVAPNGIIKTVEAQKEVFGCPTSVSPQFVKDITIFTEIFDNMARGTEYKTYDYVNCTKRVVDLNVIGCQASPTVVLPIRNQP